MCGDWLKDAQLYGAAKQVEVETLKATMIANDKRHRIQLQGYNDMQGGNNEAHANSIISAGTDTLLDRLNGVFPVPAGEASGCSADVASTSISTRTLRYCFCSDADVKRWLKNEALRNMRETLLNAEARP
jgi:hypothetical protein